MTEKDILRAMSGIDSALILDAEKPRKKTGWLKWAAVAAGFCLIVYLGFMMKIAFTGANATGPVLIEYGSIAEMNEALGRETLYSDDIIENVLYISVSYTDDGTGEADLSRPNQARIHTNNGGITVNYYVIFNRDSIKKSYIGGYEEQELRREINGITVHYSKIFDGTYHSQAQFLYGGDLYVIDVTSKEDIHDIQDYIDRILKEE
jgi:hypothetical protein